MDRLIFVLIGLAGCAESAPGLYVRDASSKWVGKSSEIEGTISTTGGRRIGVEIIATGDGEKVHVDDTDTDGRYILRDLPPAHYVVHFLLPGGERHVEIDLAASQSRTIDVVVDQAAVGKEWAGPVARQGYHDPITYPIAPASCAPLQRLLGQWKGRSTDEASKAHGPHSLAYEFQPDGAYYGHHGGPLFNTKLWAEVHVAGKWCADARYLLLLSTLHELRIANAAYAYSLDGDQLLLDSPSTGQVRLSRISPPPADSIQGGGEAKMVTGEQAERIYAPDPPYTGAAREAHFEATVVAKICVDAAGTVTSVESLKHIPQGLSESVETTVKTWRFKPYRLNGVATPFCYIGQFIFRLQ